MTNRGLLLMNQQLSRIYLLGLVLMLVKNKLMPATLSLFTPSYPSVSYRYGYHIHMHEEMQRHLNLVKQPQCKHLTNSYMLLHSR